MKINGSLVFDGSSASEIQNLRLQKVTALPGITAGDVGRLIYNSNTNIIHVGTNVGNVLSWVPLATGGDASALLAEVDRIETSLGLGPDGSFDSGAFHENFADATSYVALINMLRDMAEAATTAATAEAARATAAEGALGTRVDGVAADLATETTRATGAETALGGRIDTATAAITSETTRATGAEGALGTRIDGVTAAAATERTRVDTAIADETARATAAEGANGTAIAGEITRATNAETALGDRIDTETDAREADVAALDGRISTEVADRTAADADAAAALASEVGRATGAETALGARIDTEATDRATAISNLRTEIGSTIAGLTWEAPVDLIAADVGTVDLTGLANGYRIVDLATMAIRTVTGGALGAPEPLVDGAAFFNRTNDTGYVFNGTAVVPFSGASSFVAGNGLVMTGNRVDVVSASGTITVTEDSVDVAQSVLTSISDNAAAVAAETSRATTAETGLGQRITDETAARVAALEAEATARTNAITTETTRATGVEGALRTDVDAATAAVATEVTNRTAAVNGERDRATAAEGALGTRITNEVGTAATNAANELARVEGLVTTEVGRATGIEGTLRTDLDALSSTVDANASAVFDRVSKMYYLYDSRGGTQGDAGSKTTHVVTHNIGCMFCNVTVIDDTNNVVIPESIVFDSNDQLTITFNTRIYCKAVIMGLEPPAG